MQLSKLEYRVYETLRRNNINAFKVKDLSLLLNINKTQAYNIIKALKKKKVVKKIGGYLVLYDTDDFVTATSVHSPSYLSFLTALNYYGFSDNLSNKIFIATTKYSRNINNFNYITISRERFFGYVSIGEIVIADKEKAIIDSLLFPKYAGGLSEIIKCINAGINQLNIDKLINYAERVKSKAVLRRLRYILQELKIKTAKIGKLKEKIGEGYEMLDSNLPRKNNLNKDWLLDINT